MLKPFTLLCLPCAGASASMYLRWRNQLPEEICLVPVELPGRGARIAESAAINFSALSTQLCHEQRHLLNGDYAIFGHSMGGLLAYGMTLHCHHQGLPMPQALVVSGTAAPSHRQNDKFSERQDDKLIKQLSHYGGTPPEVFANAELLRIVLDILAADYRLCESFVASKHSPLPVPIHVFAGTEDDIAEDSLKAWQFYTSCRSSLHWFPGGHFFIQRREADVLTALCALLAPRHHPSAPSPAASVS